jgi:hypothetical protein
LSEKKDLMNQIKNLETRFKADKDKWFAEKEDLSKQMGKLQSKETQYKHEIRNKEIAL